MKKKKRKKKQTTYSKRALAKLCGCDRASVNRWLEAEGLTEPYGAAALAAIRAHQADPKAAEDDLNIDPETGLTWFQAKERETALKLRRANEVAEKSKAEEWMATSVHHGFITALVNQIELLPGKAQSKLGLDGRQTMELQRLVDELRANAADEIEKGAAV